jgi:hypothetical protein
MGGNWWSITKTALNQYIGFVNLPKHKKSPSAMQVGFMDLNSVGLGTDFLLGFTVNDTFNTI